MVRFSFLVLAGEENALGRFLKEEGKKDKTRAGKMMIAAGKTMSYTGIPTYLYLYEYK